VCSNGGRGGQGAVRHPATQLWNPLNTPYVPLESELLVRFRTGQMGLADLPLATAKSLSDRAHTATSPWTQTSSSSLLFLTSLSTMPVHRRNLETFCLNKMDLKRETQHLSRVTSEHGKKVLGNHFFLLASREHSPSREPQAKS
jgi:hypothetical protein